MMKRMLNIYLHDDDCVLHYPGNCIAHGRVEY